MENGMDKGDTVYLEDGQVCEYVAATHDGHVVRPIFENDRADEGNSWMGDPRVVRKCFAEEPKPKLTADIAALHDQADALRAEIKRLNVEKNDAWNAHRRQIETITKVPSLVRLEQFIEGKITHCVVVNYSEGPKVQTFLEACKNTSDNEYSFLKLKADDKGVPAWKFRSSHENVIPCLSIEEGKEIAAKILADQWEKWRKERLKGTHVYTWHERAKALGIEVPADVAEHVRTTAIAHIQKHKGEQERQIKVYEAQLKALGVEE